MAISIGSLGRHNSQRCIYVWFVSAWMKRSLLQSISNRCTLFSCLAPLGYSDSKWQALFGPKAHRLLTATPVFQKTRILQGPLPERKAKMSQSPPYLSRNLSNHERIGGTKMRNWSRMQLLLNYLSTMTHQSQSFTLQDQIMRTCIASTRRPGGLGVKNGYDQYLHYDMHLLIYGRRWCGRSILEL